MDPAAILRIHVAANTAAANASLAKTDAQLKRTAATASGTSAALGSKMAKAAKLGAVGLAVGVGAALVSASKKARDFETQMSNLGAVAGASGRQMRRLEKQALKLGAATQFSATEAAQAQIELAKGGLAVTQILDGGLQSALALAAAGELDLAQAGETVVNTMGLFALKGKDAMKIADMLATAANKTTVDVDDLAMSLKMGGAVAKQAGYNLNQTVQVLEALAESGVKNSDAGTSMKAAMIQLLNPTAKQAKLAKELGLNWINQNGSMKSAIQISKQLQAATDGMTKAERTKAFAVLAGTDGFRTLAALYDAGPQKLKAYEKANAKQGEAARVAAKKMDNLEGDLEELSGAWETLQIALGGPVNDAIREVVQSLTDLLNVVNKFDVSALTGDLKHLEKANEDVRDAVRIATDAWKVLGPTVEAAFGILRATVRKMLNVIGGLAQVVRGVMKIIAGILRGDWSRAWEGAKDIARGAVRILGSTLRFFRDTARSIFNGIRDIMRNIFGDAWDKVEGIFATGANAVIDVVNAVIGVINKIPGVPDIGPVGKIRTAPQVLYDRLPTRRRKQRGGPIFGGAPSGDSIPAMLERGEYVLNRKAVQALGRQRLDMINFGAAPRFQNGGFLGKAAGKVIGAARDVVGRGAGFFLKQLPQPNLPQPFTGLGPHIIDNVTDWIRGKVPKAAGADVALGAAPASLRAAMALAQKMGLTITSTTGGAHTATSWHYKGRAFDASNGSAPTAEMMQFALEVARRWGRKTLEMFYDPLGWYLKHGSKVMGAIGGHSDHVHVAMQKGGLVRGRVSYFNDGTTASGLSAATRPGLALNLNAGTDKGWNNSTTQGWMTAARGGKPVYGRVTIAGKSAVLPIIDLGPAGWTGRAIDVTQKGIEKMGFTAANFPTDAMGKVKILGGLGAVKKAGKARSSTGSKGKRAVGRIGRAVQLTSPADKPGKLGGLARKLPKSVRQLLRSPGLTGTGWMAAANMAVTLAEATEGIDDDKLALQYRISLNRRRVASLNKRLGTINKRLASRKLKPAQRKKLKERRDTLLGDLGTLKSSIIADRSTVGALTPPGSDEPDPMAEAVAAALAAMNAQTEALRLQAEAMKELADEQRRENERAEHIMGMTGREAIRSWAATMSGQIASDVGPRRTFTSPNARY